MDLHTNQIEINKPLPEWELTSIFNNKVPALENYKGKPLLILFFNLGCPGCKGRALPYANRVVVENGEHINVIGIHSRFEGPEYHIEDYIKAKEEFYIRFPFFEDENDTNTFRKYEAGGTPHWILVDQEGNLAYSIFGSDPNNALYRLDLKINELLNT
ncbi:TlpA family protein disulfide reductase [Tenacibaculum amylolyticum]|uniref:TlpA family protein disulfide reductase n=1 Tax=Tenacibaculum amylolyticum TaxID=104269 RepID=UPI003894F616